MPPFQRDKDGNIKVIDPLQGGAIVSYNPQKQEAKPITPTSLSPNVPIQVVQPQAVPPPVFPAISFTPEEIAAQNEYTAGRKQLSSLISDLAGESAFRSGLEAQQDVVGKGTLVKSLQNQLAQLNAERQGIELQLAQQQQQLLNESRGRYGLPQLGSMQDGERLKQQGALLENAIKAYSVGAQLAAAQNDYATAMDYVERAVNAEFGPKRAQIEAMRENLELLKSDPTLTSAERKRIAEVDFQIYERQRQIKQEAEDRNIVYGWAIEAQKNGAPAGLVNIALSQSPREALVTLSDYFANPNAKELAFLELQTKRAQLDKLNAEIKKTLSDVEKSEEEKVTASKIAKLDPNSPTFTLDIIRSSAGGKTLTEEQMKPLNKAALVLSQVAELKKSLEGVNTDPILGILRDNNPYDVKARSIRAQLQAIVPNLARGIYGEVGVLTDQDIANYIQTLPNIRTPEEANKMILDMTLRVIKNSFETQLQILSAGGRDTTGFEPILDRFNSTLEKAKMAVGPKKAGESDASYVERAVTNSGFSYDDIINAAEAGEIVVVNNKTGEIEYIPAENFTSNYTRL